MNYAIIHANILDRSKDMQVQEDKTLLSQLLRPTANALEVGACNCPVVERLTPPTFSRLV